MSEVKGDFKRGPAYELSWEEMKRHQLPRTLCFDIDCQQFRDFLADTDNARKYTIIAVEQTMDKKHRLVLTRVLV